MKIDVNQVGQAIIATIIIIGAIVSYIQARKAKVKAEIAATRVQEIHVMVNSQKTDMEKRIAVLEHAVALYDRHKRES